MKQKPLILCIGGHDPSGGAGIQADIESVNSLGGQALTLITALTCQDTHNIHELTPVPSTEFVRRMEVLLADVRPDAVKIGLVAHPDFVEPLSWLVDRFTGPVVLDPVLAAGGGFDTGDPALVEAIQHNLVPHATLVTPNHAEICRLTTPDDVDAGAAELIASGAEAVLLTGADVAVANQVENRLYVNDGPMRRFHWPLLPHRYHGSGCTLASACATRLALGDNVESAAERAQAFTWHALERATRPGSGQWIPGRQS